ncbi:MAG: hypothetical protein GXO71_04605 [Caldiserica bacterium]|nr:hypothetical protein [Caldisericota bacterium]
MKRIILVLTLTLMLSAAPMFAENSQEKMDKTKMGKGMMMQDMQKMPMMQDMQGMMMQMMAQCMKMMEGMQSSPDSSRQEGHHKGGE